MPKETPLYGELQLEAGRHGAILWRNNSGVATYPGGAKVRYGVGEGGADLIGLVPVTITADMVGQTVAVFLAVEAKAGRRKATEEQARFLALVRKKGGIALVATDTATLAAALSDAP